MHWTSEHLQPTLIWLFEWYLEEKGKGGWSVGVPLSVPLLPPKGYLQPFIFLALEGKKETNIYWVGTQGRPVVVRNYCILIIHSFIPMLVMERHTSFLHGEYIPEGCWDEVKKDKMKQISGGTRQSNNEGALRMATGNCDGEAGLSLYIGWWVETRRAGPRRTECGWGYMGSL